MIPVYKPTITDVEKRYVRECLDTGWISSKGPFVERFERKFADYVGARFAASVSNGTVALHAALLALGIGPGDEVIVPTLTFIASANAVAYTGARPVFVDSLRGTWQMDPRDVRRAITDATRAIMPVHLYGGPCDMAALSEIAREHGLVVIEDCAEALGTRIDGQHVGTFGDIAAFSFYGNKTITTGEGGMVVTNNPMLAERTTRVRGQGLARSREYWHDIIGYNYRMTNICAAIGCAQLERVEETLFRKQGIAAHYRNLLDDLVEFQQFGASDVHSQWMTSILVRESRLRDMLRHALQDQGIETRPVFYPVHSMPMYAESRRRTPVADDVSSRGVTLPSFPELTLKQVEFIAGRCRSFLRHEGVRRRVA